ncbi:MAG: hypothetical protein PUC65_14550 [Clostridiales bacterium]|nr:hypothetical protein [Clostridiales bacterium]
MISNRKDRNFLVGVNDYATYDVTDKKQPAFVYFAGAEVECAKDGEIPKGIQ